MLMNSIRKKAPTKKESKSLRHLTKNCTKECRPRFMVDQFKKFLSKIPSQMFNFYIPALLIPNYRPEWGKFSAWIPDTDDGPATAVKKKTPIVHRTENKYHHNHLECSRVLINVSGTIFETQLRTLNRFPETLLGDPARRLRFYDPVNDQYFFDRHASSFEGIFHYFQSGGTLRRPMSVSLEIFHEEANFFGISQVAIQKMRLEEGIVPPEETKITSSNLYLKKIWLLLEYPESSLQARIVTILSVYVIILSIFVFCIETLPEFHSIQSNQSVKMIEEEELTLELTDPFYFVETICVCWFALELILRFISSPNKIDFVTSLNNIVDLISILPYFVQLASQEKKGSDNRPRNRAEKNLAFLRVIRLVRVFRIFKLSRHSKGLQVLGLTLKASIRELGLLMFFLVIGVTLFSSAMYFAEIEHDNFSSILDAFWWGVITMTTVGYGDVTPQGGFGRFIGSLCAIAGVLALALPIPVIVSNFNYFYQRETEHGDLPGVNLSQVHMCSFLPGNYKADTYKEPSISEPEESNDSILENNKHWDTKHQRRKYSSSYDKEDPQFKMALRQSIMMIDDSHRPYPPPPTSNLWNIPSPHHPPSDQSTPSKATTPVNPNGKE